MNRAFLVVVVLSGLACGDTEVICPDGPARDGSCGEPDGGPSTCASHDDCSDGLYCTGVERCEPTAAGADVRGCVAAPPPCPADSCLESMRTCEGSCPDADGDGYADAACGGTDCDDANPDIHPGAVEVCDPMHVDEDCDPSTIAGPEGDVDGDGHISDRCCNPLVNGRLFCGDDCNDNNADVRPGILDICNGRDDDCDGRIDEDPDQTFYRDVDGDGFGVETDTVLACSAPPGYAVMAGDCNDNDRNINPAAGEICDGIDNNCSGTIDDATGGCDCVDGSILQCGGTSNVGACRVGSQSCVAGSWQTCVGAQGPVTERCSGQDDDCDGLTDDEDPDIATGDPVRTGATRYYEDRDGDGYGNAAVSRLLCTAIPGWVPVAGDCNDNNRNINPAAAEICDGIDNNCSGTADDAPDGCDCITGTSRECGPTTNVGYCQIGSQVCVSGAWQACVGALFPQTEICNGDDDDCDGLTDDADPDIRTGDPSITRATRYYIDRDGDGFGDPTESELRCTPRAGWVTNGNDCNDRDPDINPAALEICDNRDNNCSGTVDDAPSGCACIDGTSRPCGSDTNVGACQIGSQVCVSGRWQTCVGAQGPRPERCGGGDRDCDGLVDDNDPDIESGNPENTGARLFYWDEDGDGFGDSSRSMYRCAPASRWVPVGGDCDDSRAAIGNTTLCYPDHDGDGYGRTEDVQTVVACECPPGWVIRPGDCVDTGAPRSHLIHPGAGFQSQGHCNGNNSTCTTSGGRDGCFTCGTLGCLCLDFASFDYDCDGATSVQPPLSCSTSGGLCPAFGRTGPTSTHPSTACGTEVPWSQCTASCSRIASGTGRLSCR
ncbi:MAG: putative metal-binding motif-containing protein [Myxococcales bacterium]|nr:putative metal-binding motif-containing protein [Myxococcales bacterium]